MLCARCCHSGVCQASGEAGEQRVARDLTTGTFGCESVTVERHTKGDFLLRRQSNSFITQSELNN